MTTLPRVVRTLLLIALTGASTANAQTVAWENSGQTESGGAVAEIGVTRRVVVASGSVFDSLGNGLWFVRGVDRRTGQTLWEDRFGPATFSNAKDLVIEGRRVFAAGWVWQPGRGLEFVVRAHDVMTGNVLWSQEIGLGPRCSAESPGIARCVGKALSVRDGRLFAVGHLTRTAGRSDFAVLAFDAATGAQLWESVTDPTGTGTNDYAWAVKAVGDSVFVVGEVGDFSGLVLRAHDAATGKIRWQQHLPEALNFSRKETLEADGQTVFIGGTDALGGFFVSAYDADTGALRWQDHVDDGALTGLLLHDAEDDGRPGKQDDRHGKDDERLLLATGVVGCDPVTFLDCKLAIHAYSPRKGRLLWKRADKAAGGDWYYPRIVAGPGGVFIGARELLEDSLYHGTIRAYRLDTGRRMWTTRFDSGSGFPESGVNDLSVFEGRLYVGGHIGRPDGDFDFIVREYHPR